MRPLVRTWTGVGTWWPKVSLLDPVAALRMRRLLDEALIWLAAEECDEHPQRLSPTTEAVR
jgi:hypothetical protein